MAKLQQHAGVVVQNVFEKNLVFQRDTVRNHENVNSLVGRRPIIAVAVVRAADNGAMGCVIADLVVAGPDDFVGDELNVRVGTGGMVRVRDNFLATELKTVIVLDVRGV